MKLTKRDRRTLEGILHNLDRAQRYILSDRVAIVIKDSQATTTHHLINQVGQIFTGPIEKNIGTELCCLYSATGALEKALRPGPAHGASEEST
jgi:hypothetical protein